MGLRFSFALIAAMAPGLSALPQKQAPTPTSTDSLATVNGILGYCAHIDPRSSGQYLQRLKMFSNNGNSGDDDRDDDDKNYKKHLTAIDTQLKKVPFSTGFSACKAFLVGR